MRDYYYDPETQASSWELTAEQQKLQIVDCTEPDTKEDQQEENKEKSQNSGSNDKLTKETEQEKTIREYM